MSAIPKPAAPRDRVDPITLEVVRYSLVAMMDETEANLTRTAFSTIIREFKDYCVGLVTAKGETIAQGRGSIPTFVADLGSPVLDGLAMWGEDIREGDYLINNYAGVCGQHLNNVVMYTPIFDEGKIIGRLGCSARLCLARGRRARLRRRVQRWGCNRYPGERRAPRRTETVARSMKRRLGAAVALLALTFPLAAFAQAWPAKPVRVIMTVGSGADLMARLIGQKVGDAIGQPLVTEIQSAAGGSIGTELVARAAPDGYTLLLTAAFSQINRGFLARNTPYDPVRDFTPIAQIASTVSAVAAHPSLPAQNMKELVDYARRNPGKVAYGSSGVGTTGHLSMELISMLTGVKFLHVPYKSGSQSVSDLLGGQIPVSVVSLSPVLNHAKSGKVKLLAMNTRERFRLMPDVPTVGEQISGYEPPPAWTGYLGPAGLPEAIVRRLNAEMNAAMRSGEVREKLEAIGFLVTEPNTPAQFALTIRNDLEHVRKIVNASGIQPE